MKDIKHHEDPSAFNCLLGNSIMSRGGTLGLIIALAVWYLLRSQVSAIGFEGGFSVPLMFMATLFGVVGAGLGALVESAFRGRSSKNQVQIDSKVPTHHVPISRSMPTVLKPASEAVERPVRSTVTPSNDRVLVNNSTLVETICVETPNGELYPLFEKGTTLPLMRQETFLTVPGSEGAIEIKVYQGESPLQEKSDPIAGYRIRSVIVPSEICVTFKVALDGQLSVEACDILRDKALLVIAEWSTDQRPG